ncbi:MAG TPA: YbjN domain-containing protein, partial [Bradyrhizobium sp.]|nr:YbjN domain-containing protein [Bradyrhizobium sp.]
MTSVSIVEPTPFSGNPIDLVEEIVIANDWAHDRASEEELVVEISGRWCDYRMYFVWQEELCALHFSCGFDMKVSKGRRSAVYELLALANEKLWLGHFDLSAEENSPAFRHAV